MKNNKAFTLVEVIVTISLMLLIAAIAIPSVINISNKKDKKQCEKLVELVKEKAVVYARLQYDPRTGGTFSNTPITLQTLIDAKLFDNIVKNKMFETNFPATTTIEFSNVDSVITAAFPNGETCK